MNTFENIYELVAKIPKGKVTTYGRLAKMIGTTPKVVGYALHSNNDPKNVPCHRVINSKGEISKGYAFGGPENQRKLLEKEGVRFNKNNRVNLEKLDYFI
ncbi:MAG: methylated-DNA-protein-cysteine methyltransferase [uncultured bacterium]|nr:MAG: methylated-DNA-protein-cysteine methyltransferase [uncultured bacterium]OGH44671.1 MAG: cysteine methyltransferase [Candidatus Levybacteria bacterium RIFCSPLOWO2_02_FULL_37_11]